MKTARELAQEALPCYCHLFSRVNKTAKPPVVCTNCEKIDAIAKVIEEDRKQRIDAH